MNRGEVVSLLSEAIGKASPSETAEEDDWWKADTRRFFENYKLAEPIKEALEREPEFGEGAGFAIHGESGWSSLGADVAAQALVERARLKGSEAAVAWLETLLSTESAEGLSVLALWGVETPARVDFEGGISLVPFVQLPDSRSKKFFLEPPNLSFLRDQTPWALRRAPSAALIHPVTIRPLISDLRNGKPEINRAGSHHAQMKDVATVLTAAGPCGSVVAGSWFQYSDLTLEAASLLAGAHGTSHLEIVPQALEDKAIVTGVAKDLVDGYFRFSVDDRPRVLLAADRLNRAIRRAGVGDQLMELAISLECILAEGHTENTFKVGLRAAIVLGGSHSDRMQNRAIVEAIYSGRSAVVHTGKAPAKLKVKRENGKRESREIAEMGIGICARVIRGIVSRREIPDWFAFETGNGD